MKARFHLAFAVHDLAAARAFYGDLLGCSEGRSAERWVDFNFFGHQITAHLSETPPTPSTNLVDGDNVPAHHFGAILEWHDWEQTRDKLIAANIPFRIAPRIRFKGQVGEQATMFFDDPSGNVLELKSFRDPKQIFAT